MVRIRGAGIDIGALHDALIGDLQAAGYRITRSSRLSSGFLIEFKKGVLSGGRVQASGSPDDLSVDFSGGRDVQLALESALRASAARPENLKPLHELALEEARAALGALLGGGSRPSPSSRSSPDRRNLRGPGRGSRPA
ncbi:MAG: hypothetical protein QXE23_07230 [Nitrososphaerota archaeon]